MWPLRVLKLTRIRQPRRSRKRVPHFHDLPVEVLLCIFLFVAKMDGCAKCRATPLRLRGSECPCRLPPQFLVSTVCRRWRSVATRYACLWATLRLSSTMPAKFLRRVAARAGGVPDDREVGATHGATALPLSLHLTLRASDVASTDSLGAMMQLVAAEHRRLRKLHVVASSSEPLAAFVNAVSQLAMPILDTLEIIPAGGS